MQTRCSTKCSSSMRSLLCYRNHQRIPIVRRLRVMESFFCGKSTPTSSYSAIFRVLYIVSLCGFCCFGLVASSPVGCCNVDANLVENFIGCMPLAQKYLTGYYIEKHNTLPGTDFHGFLACEFCFHNCEWLTHNTSDVLGFLKLHRHLVGEGSHRRLTSTMTFNIQPDIMSWFDTHFCEAVFIEKLPIGVFADPFELQHLVQRQVYLGAVVFGDTNLELPSALSNQSIVEVHMDFQQGNLSNREIVIELPLHARYPPLDGSGYSTVEMGSPDLFVRCRPKSSQHETFYWTLTSLSASAGSSVVWSIPCGNQGHTGFVSIVTFVSALFSALLLVFSAMYCSANDGIKSS